MNKIIFNLIFILVIISCRDFNEINIQESLGAKAKKRFMPEIAFPNVDKEIIKLPNGLRLEKLDSIYIMGGDIILTQSQVDILSKQVNTKASITSEFIKYWPLGIIYYDFAPNFIDTNRVHDAMQLWKNNTGLLFVRRTTYDRIYFINSNGNYSQIGCVGGRQDIGLSADSDFGIAAHEIGHAIGLIHEHQRFDRDLYVDVMYNNIKSAYYKDFDIVFNSMSYGTFDFNSIMLYASYVIDQNAVYDTAQPVLRKKNGETWRYANRSYISDYDKEIVRYIYGPPYAHITTSVISAWDNVWGSGSEWEYNYKNVVYFYTDRTYNQRTIAYSPRLLHFDLTITEKEYLGDPITNSYLQTVQVIGGNDSILLNNTTFSGLDEFGEIKRFYQSIYYTGRPNL